MRFTNRGSRGHRLSPCVHFPKTSPPADMQLQILSVRSSPMGQSRGGVIRAKVADLSFEAEIGTLFTMDLPEKMDYRLSWGFPLSKSSRPVSWNSNSRRQSKLWKRASNLVRNPFAQSMITKLELINRKPAINIQESCLNFSGIAHLPEPRVNRRAKPDRGFFYAQPNFTAPMIARPVVAD